MTARARIAAVRAAVYRFFHADEWLDSDGASMRRIRAMDDQRAFERGMDDDRVVEPPRVASDGPATSALKKPWSAGQ